MIRNLPFAPDAVLSTALTRVGIILNKIVKKVLDGTVSLPEEYSRLIEEAALGHREEQLTFVGAEG